MSRDEERPPESPTAIGMQTGMEVPGLEDIRWPQEEALVTGDPLSGEDRCGPAPDRPAAPVPNQRSGQGA